MSESLLNFKTKKLNFKTKKLNFKTNVKDNLMRVNIYFAHITKILGKI